MSGEDDQRDSDLLPLQNTITANTFPLRLTTEVCLVVQGSVLSTHSKRKKESCKVGNDRRITLQEYMRRRLCHGHIQPLSPPLCHRHIKSLPPTLCYSHIQSLSPVLCHIHIKSLSPALCHSHIQSLSPALCNGHIQSLSPALCHILIESLPPSFDIQTVSDNVYSHNCWIKIYFCSRKL